MKVNVETSVICITKGQRFSMGLKTSISCSYLVTMREAPVRGSVRVFRTFSVGQMDRLGTQAGFLCCHFEVESLLQGISGFALKALNRLENAHPYYQG